MKKYKNPEFTVYAFNCFDVITDSENLEKKTQNNNNFDPADSKAYGNVYWKNDNINKIV